MFDATDPRTTGEYVRRLPGAAGAGDVVLIGVVHGHPASTYRVQAAVDAIDPAVLALELPPMAVPLFERYAADERIPPADGGEMSAAIQAARTDAVVGIDGPTPAFLWRLARSLYREDTGRSATRPLLRGLVSVTKHAIACRLAASFGPCATRWLPADDSVAHECGWHDDPELQAADERTQIRRAETVSNVFGRSNAVHVRDVTREAHMADRLAELRARGTAVAVIGMGHLCPVARHLT